ncbi:MAG: M23 family metallopeptidase, partial [Bacteroidia bacterium]|nr:M23 family metallopeptidase [Bacteroidia bacterium]
PTDTGIEMKKTLYVYNNQSLQFEKHRSSTRSKLAKIAILLGSIILLSGAFSYAKLQINPSAESESLMREMKQMEFQYMALNDQVIKLSSALESIQETDANVHRLMFGMDPIDDNVWNGGVGGHDKFQDLTMYKNSGELIRNATNKVDLLARQMKLQSSSLDSLLALAKTREEMFASIPSIKPIREDKLARKIRLLSGFGMRIHPVHKTPKHHNGLDFTANTNTPIYATGNGVVVRVENRKTGYGKNIIVNHGYGYKTLYGHMSKINVKVGDKVTKGQEIGLVGNTGTSTAPHLHYEVHLNGKAVDPILYCMDGLSAEEYQQLVAAASKANQSFD